MKLGSGHYLSGGGAGRLGIFPPEKKMALPPDRGKKIMALPPERGKKNMALPPQTKYFSIQIMHDLFAHLYPPS
jgi:hypothetical protein